MSTTSYGDAPNELELMNTDAVGLCPGRGLRRDFRNDAHRPVQASIFGASKLAADVMVQEYGGISAADLTPCAGMSDGPPIQAWIAWISQFTS